MTLALIIGYGILARLIREHLPARSDVVLLVLTVLFLVLGFGIAGMGLFLFSVISVLLCSLMGASVISRLFCIVAVVLVFVLFKNYFNLSEGVISYFSGERILVPELIGLSFVVFKSIDLALSDSKNYLSIDSLHQLTFFPSCIAGPIHRVGKFDLEQKSDRYDKEVKENIINGIKRVSNGLFFFGFLNAPLYFIFTRVDDLAEYGPYAPMIFPSLCAVYFVYLYLNFSSFSSIVIGSSLIAGYKVPENFGKPFTASNFLDFWNHWHLSVSQWFKDRVFNPITYWMVKRGYSSNVILSTPGLVISFGLLGVWHGRTLPFLICGLLFAVGALICHLHLQTYPGARQKMNEVYIANILGRSFTQVYIGVAISAIWVSPYTFVVSFSRLLYFVLGCLLAVAMMVFFNVFITELERFARKSGIYAVYSVFWNSQSGFVNAIKMFVGLVLASSIYIGLGEELVVYKEF